MTALERFLHYVTVYTTSDESTGTSPSTERQKTLGRALMAELNALELHDAAMDGAGNVTATLPGTAPAPRIALIAHMDTAPDAPGEHVRPQIRRYEGRPLALGAGVTLDEAFSPELAQFVGQDIVTASGDTLLGADDKAGVAEIMTAAAQLLQSDRPHGAVRLVVTTDEEIGNGVDGLDVDALGCDYGYTVDGGALGEIEYENFNAAGAVLRVHGVGVHPGSAKGVMRNAATAAMAFHAMLPPNETPECTEGYEGFYHLTDMRGSVTEAELKYIIRDHDRARFEARKQKFADCAAELNRRYGGPVAEVELRDSYYNMKEKIAPHTHLIERAKRAFAQNGVAPRTVPIRGGTDGARLSWMGLPCPNLSTGGYCFHGVHEWIPAAAPDKMAQVLVDLVAGFAE